MEAFLLGQEPSLTRVQVAERAGVPLDLAVTLWHQLGFPHRDDDDVAFAESDVEALRLTRRPGRDRASCRPSRRRRSSARGAAATPASPSGRRRCWPASPLEGGDPAAGADRARQRTSCPASRRCRATSGAATSPAPRSTCSRTPARSPRPRPQLSVCFVDIVGYTTQSRGLDGAELVEWVDRFEQDTTTLVVDHAGQVIKTIGDEVLFTVADPAAAVTIALALAARGDDADDPFPAVRAGIAHGAVVRRLGDVFGSTVNAASRLTSAARPGTRAGRRGRPRGADRCRGRRRRSGAGAALRRVSAKGFDHLEAWRVKARPGVLRGVGKCESPVVVDGGNNNDRAVDESTPPASAGTTFDPVVFEPWSERWTGPYRIVTCRLASPARADLSAALSSPPFSASSRSAANARGRLLQHLGAGAEREVPDRGEQAVGAEHADEPRVLGDRVLAGGVQAGERVEELVLGVRHDPAQVLLGADVGPVRRLDRGQPDGGHHAAVGLLERGLHGRRRARGCRRSSTRSRRAR